MIDPETRKAIYLLHKKGMGLRKISRSLNVARETVRKIIEAKGELPASIRTDRIEIAPELLRRLYKECDGYRQRVYEKLLEEEKWTEGAEEEAEEETEEEKKKKKTIGYSTLTRRLRELEIGTDGERCDRVEDKPGAEMQQDTTSYLVTLAGRPTRLIASVLYLRYSKRRYLKFYRRFNRFSMKSFLHEALTFWGYSAAVCIIDNTNLARLRGTGKDAVIVPEMESFAKRHGFHFKCHALRHANRKAGNERSFYTVKSNFLPGRRFSSLEDINAQAFHWATVTMEEKPVGKAKVIPAKAFEHEASELTKLPPYLPAPYLPLKRGIDQYGYVVVDTNYYWVPGDGRGQVGVLLYGDRLEIYRRRQRLAEYRLPADGVRNQCFSPEGYPKPRYKPRSRKKPTSEEEKRLRALGEEVAGYLDFALKEKGPQKRHRFIRELFALSRQLSAARLSRALERALKYGITSVETVRTIAHLLLREEAEELPIVEVDAGFQEREAYLEGRLSEEPDFSIYDDLLEDEADG